MTRLETNDFIVSDSQQDHTETTEKWSPQSPEEIYNHRIAVGLPEVFPDSFRTETLPNGETISILNLDYIGDRKYDNDFKNMLTDREVITQEEAEITLRMDMVEVHTSLGVFGFGTGDCPNPKTMQDLMKQHKENPQPIKGSTRAFHFTEQTINTPPGVGHIPMTYSYSYHEDNLRDRNDEELKAYSTRMKALGKINKYFSSEQGRQESAQQRAEDKLKKLQSL